MDSLKPWARGPFELLRHADSHFRKDTDFDKRISLIGFDNAIEVTITAYLQLHPSQRGGKSYEKRKIEEWLSNYHKKIQFFQDFIKSENIPQKIGTDEIIWYHNLRNELYHAGNGMVPEKECLVGSRRAAIWVFHSLFNVDPEPYFKYETPNLDSVSQKDMKYSSSSTQFLKNFLEYENIKKVAEKGTFRSYPENIVKTNILEDNEWFKDAEKIKNDIVKGKPINFENKHIKDINDILIKKLSRISNTLENKKAFRGDIWENKTNYKGKYQKLGDYLRNSNKNEITLSFEEIERILDISLPNSALLYVQWWKGGHNHELTWREAGYTIGSLKLGKFVEFKKIGT